LANGGTSLPTPSSCNVNWSTGNFTATVTVQYFYDIPPLNIPATSSATQNIRIGIQSSPCNSCISVPNYICTTTTAPFTVSTSGGLPLGADVYDWFVTGSGSISGSNTGSSITVNITGTGSIIVNLRFKNTGCNTYSSSTSKTILRATTAPPIPTLSAFSRIGVSCIYQVVASASNASNYIWATNSSFTNSTTGNNTAELGDCTGTCTFSIYCKAQNGCGVSAYKYKSSSVTAPGNCQAIIQNPNDDPGNQGSENFEVKSLNSEEIIQLNVFEIFPNPTQNSFKITTSQIDQIIKIDVFNYNGQLVLNKQMLPEENTLDIDVSRLSNGLYFVKATSQDGYSINQMSKLEIVR
jgi:hypothetical protein